MEQVIKFVLESILGIVGGLFDLIFDSLNGLLSHERKTHYDSDFMSSPSDILSRHNEGFNLNGISAITKKDSFSNCSVFGPSGSGKSSVVILPTIFSLAKGGSTICCNDPSGELFEKVSGWLAQLGYIILCIDFSMPDRSESFNPLARCRTISDIQKVVHLIIRNTVGDSKGDPFWDRSAEMLITLFARYLVFYASPEYRTMNNVLRLIETFATNPKKIDPLFVATHDEELLNQYKATIVTGDKTLQSIISTARAALNIFSDPTVIQTTSTDTIDFSRFRTGKSVALFICNPIKDLHYYKPLSALFFETLFNEIMSRIPKPGERAIFCILEEAATMKFSSLGTVISNIRKYVAGIMLVVQDYQALVALYGPSEAHNIRTNTYAQVYLKGQPNETCKELETILGRFTYTDEKGTEKVRLLMSADEIRKSEEAIILCGNLSPIKSKMTPYFSRTTLRKRSEMPPYQPPIKSTTFIPPLIPL